MRRRALIRKGPRKFRGPLQCCFSHCCRRCCNTRRCVPSSIPGGSLHNGLSRKANHEHSTRRHIQVRAFLPWHCGSSAESVFPETGKARNCWNSSSSALAVHTCDEMLSPDGQKKPLTLRKGCWEQMESFP